MRSDLVWCPLNCTLKKDHATPYLRELHWLPVRERITFKILVYVYKCIHGLAPPYLTSLLRLHCPARPGLRSASDTTRLFQHNTIRSLQTASNQAFSIAAPQIWNSLAISIRNSPSLDTFKKALKLKLFPIECVFVHIFLLLSWCFSWFLYRCVSTALRSWCRSAVIYQMLLCMYVCMYVCNSVSYQDNRELSICTTDGFCDGKTSNVASSPQRLSSPSRVIESGWPTDDKVDACAHDSKCQFNRPRFIRRANRKLHNIGRQ